LGPIYDVGRRIYEVGNLSVPIFSKIEGAQMESVHVRLPTGVEHSLNLRIEK